MSTKLELTAQAIVKNPAAYGIAFVRVPSVEKNGKLFYKRLVLHVADPVLFRATFPEFADARLESGVRIASQAHARNTLPDAEVMDLNARMLIGERVSKPQLRYGASDGTMYATREEAIAASAAIVAAEVERRMKQA